jgi:putative NADH-flavin reductase
MKLIIFGATGTVGKQLLQQALFNGNQVRAFGRNVYTADYLPVNSDVQTENLQLVQGALFDEGEVFSAIKGCDAVLSVIGGGSDGTDKTRTLGMKNIIRQMQKAGVKRIVALGGSGILNADEDTLLVDHEDYPKKYIPVGKEHQKAYEMLKESGLDWTMVGSPEIISNAPTGAFITAANYEPQPNKYRINAGDLAMFMLNELERNEFVKQRVGISN